MDVEKQIRMAIGILKKGGVIAFPTDTVYGLGASSNLEQAVERIYQIKRRPRRSPLPLLLADITQLTLVAYPVTPLAQCLAGRFLPGGLTLVLHKSSTILDVITAGGDTVAIRIPAHPLPIALVRGLGAPIIGTSANLSGKPSAVTAEGVCHQIGKDVDFIIKGDRCPGAESTVVDATAEYPRILREGAISAEEIRRCASL
jgi:L-threonylcarbamoyladenylate synthase